MPPAEAVLLRLAREAAGITQADAAARLAARFQRKFTPARWSQLEGGYETRDGVCKPISPPPHTCAQMAFIVGIGPGRLIAAGRADAARVLEEILRNPRAAEPATPATPDGHDDLETVIRLLTGVLDPSRQELIADLANAANAGEVAIRLLIELVDPARPMLRVALERGMRLQDGNGRPLPGRIGLIRSTILEPAGAPAATAQSRSGTSALLPPA